jgi:hypothetical protein
MEDSLNLLLDRNRELDVLVTFSVFSYRYHSVFTDKPIKEVERFTIRLDRGTALIMSACKMIDEVGARLATLPENDRPAKVMFVIVTDGMENASPPEYTREHLMEKIKEQTEVYNWLFLYLGANQDSMAVAKSYGINPDRAVNWKSNREGTRRTSERLSKKLREVNKTEANDLQNIIFDEMDRQE